MLVAPVLSVIPLFPTNPFPSSFESRKSVFKYYFRSLVHYIKGTRFAIAIIIIVLISLFVGYVASALNFIDLSNYFIMNSQGELVREGSPPSQLTSRIDISKSAYFANIIATSLGGFLLTVTRYHAKNEIAEQVVGVAIAASFAPPASALGLALTLDNRWNLVIPVLFFLFGNTAALFAGINLARLFSHIQKRRIQLLKTDIIAIAVLFPVCTITSTIFLISTA